MQRLGSIGSRHAFMGQPWMAIRNLTASNSPSSMRRILYDPGVSRMVMVLPFAMALIAAVLACLGRATVALWLGLATIAIQVWWLIYHATDALKISL